MASDLDIPALRKLVADDPDGLPQLTARELTVLLDAAEQLRAVMAERDSLRLAAAIGAEIDTTHMERMVEIATLRESLHYANGVADLAMQHRDSAEAGERKAREYLDDAQVDLWAARAERDQLRAQRDAMLALAERVAPFFQSYEDCDENYCTGDAAGQHQMRHDIDEAIRNCKETNQ